MTPENDITVSSQFGVNGIVQITTPGIEPEAELVELKTALVDPKQIAAGCIRSHDSRFVVTGRGGIPDNPIQLLRSDRAWADTRDLSEFRTSRPVAPIAPASIPIIEASTLQQTNGQVELVAVNSPAPLPQGTTCARATPLSP